MKPRERRETGKTDRFRSRLDQIINMNCDLVRLAKGVSWEAIEARCGEVYSDGPGMPPLPTRLMAGLVIQKHTFNLSDEVLCACWVMKRRNAVEPAFGHIKNGHRTDRNYLAGTQGNAIKAILAAARYNFHLLPT